MKTVNLEILILNEAGDRLVKYGDLGHVNSWKYRKHQIEPDAFTMSLNPRELTESGYNIAFWEKIFEIKLDFKEELIVIRNKDIPWQFGYITDFTTKEGANPDDYVYEFSGFNFDKQLEERILPNNDVKGRYKKNTNIYDILNETYQWCLISAKDIGTAQTSGTTNANRNILYYDTELVNPWIAGSEPAWSVDERLKTMLETWTEIINLYNAENIRKIAIESELVETVISGEYKVRFNIVRGENRIDNIIFSTLSGSVNNFETSRMLSGYVNMGLVCGQGEEELREYVKVEDNLSGWKRKEIIIDSTDSETTSDLEKKGKEKLTEFDTSLNINGEINEETTPYKLWDGKSQTYDYYLADNVKVIQQLEINNVKVYEAEIETHVSGIVFIFENDISTISLEVGDKKITKSKTEISNEQTVRTLRGR